MAVYPAINLAALPTPSAVTVPSFDAILAARLQYFQTLWTAAQAADPSLPNYDVAALETDPVVMLQETGAYREVLIDQRINDAVLATSLAWSQGTDIDVIAANYQTLRALNETDATLKLRAQLAWEALSQGGTYGGYRYRALSAAPADLGDVAVYGPEVAGVAPGEVRIVCLGTAANGVPSAAALAAVKAAFASRGNRKVNDNVTVFAATPIPYSVQATLILNQGADPTSVVAAQRASLAAFAASRQTFGGSVSPNNVAAALGSNNGLVYDVTVTTPASIVAGDLFSAPWLTGALINWTART